MWGVVMMIFLPDSPVTAKGLNEREKRIAVERLRDNQTGIENKHLKWYQVREAFTEYVRPSPTIVHMLTTFPNTVTRPTSFSFWAWWAIFRLVSSIKIDAVAYANGFVYRTEELAILEQSS